MPPGGSSAKRATKAPPSAVSPAKPESTRRVGRIAEASGAPRVRVEAAAAQHVGLAFLRYVVQVEPLASADEEMVMATVAPTVQHYLLGG